jgi:glutathione S-transferase
MGKPEDASIVQLAFSRIRAAGDVLNVHFADRPLVVGDRLTLADIAIAAPFSQSDRTKVPFGAFPNLTSWQQRLPATVPAWANTKREVDRRIDSALQAANIDV